MRTPLSLLLALAVVAPGCASGDAKKDPTRRLDVVTAVYPLAYLAEVIGGSHVTVHEFTPAGEPHDVELSPAQVATIESASLMLVIPGFQPAMDDAADAAITPDLLAGWKEKVIENDPHVWLDPLMYKHVAQRIAEELGKIDEANKDAYLKASSALQLQLVGLHVGMRKELGECKSHDLVTSHAAFGWFANRYFLKQVGIASVADEAEPSPRRIADAVEYMLRNKVTTVFAESPDSKPARTVAREAKAKIALLQTIETSDGGDYFTVMKQNSATLHKALRCT